LGVCATSIAAGRLWARLRRERTVLRSVMRGGLDPAVFGSSATGGSFGIGAQQWCERRDWRSDKRQYPPRERAAEGHGGARSRSCRGQAVVGNVETQGEGSPRNQRINPMLLHMRQAPRCGARTRSGSRCRSPAMPNGRCRMHGGPSSGAPKGNKHALKSGRYTADAIARRREIRELLRAMKASASTAREQT
jgi:hypothetical protein